MGLGAQVLWLGLWQMQGDRGQAVLAPGCRVPRRLGPRCPQPVKPRGVPPHLHPVAVQHDTRGTANHTCCGKPSPRQLMPFFFLIKKKKSPGCISSRKTTLFSGSLISPLPNILFLRAGRPGPIETSSCHWLTSFPRLSTISSALNNLIKTTFWSERSNNYY